MQSDIVERLLSVERGQGHSFSVHGPYDTPVRRVVPYGNMMHEAATEITALRERVAKLEGALRLARPVVEADLCEAREHSDADWEGMSYEALSAIDAALGDNDA